MLHTALYGASPVDEALSIQYCMDRMDKDRLTPQDWMAAAFDALASGGVEAVRVDVLAKRLKVTRGSFYWHFKNRRALLNALQEMWRAEQTEDVIAQVEALEKPPHEALHALLTLCFRDDGALEKAMRAWAESDPAVQQLVAEVDQRRIGYLAKLLNGMGFTKPKATVRARIAYRAWLGQYALTSPLKRHNSSKDVNELYALLAT